MKSFYKILFYTALILIIGCSSNENDTENNNNNSTEHKSTHESDREEYSKEKKNISDTNNYSVVVNDVEAITKKSSGAFHNPKYTNDGKYLVFTNENYGQIWIYDVFSKIDKKVIEMPQSGFGFQLSENSQEIYFRSKNSIQKERLYSFYKYSISDDKLEKIYSSSVRITIPALVNNSLYFLENNEPKSFDLKTQKITEEYSKPYFFVKNNNLFRFLEKLDEVKIPNKKITFISCEHSKDGEVIFALTANNGILAINLKGELIKEINSANSISKLYKSNLIVFTEEKDDGMKVLSSDLRFGFINSANEIKIKKGFNEPIFNPDWSPVDNKLAYSSDNGIINILSFKIEKIAQ